MFDIGWSEMAIVMLVALVVIGPKDLPRVAREIGRWTGKARAMARDFHRAIDDMAREADLDDLKKTVDDARSISSRRGLSKAIDPDGSLERAFDVSDAGGKKTRAKALEPAAPAASAPPDPPPPSSLSIDGAVEPPAAVQDRAEKPADTTPS
ncbi:MAG: twin-arginine translocase subunit TatB [Geminicoccaceae bacterium]|nr:twin-arginine translocase subunit TatB [Geminicoccaceae bacterium]